MENIPNVPQLPWIPSFYNFNVNCNLEFLLKFIKEELSNLEDIQYFLIKNKFSIKFYINNYLIYIKIRIYKYNVNDKLNYLIDISFMNGNKFIFIRWFRALRYNLYINF